LSVAAADIEAALRAALAPTALEIQDDSHLHVGHAGAREGRHFSVRIASPRFKGLAPVARHRLVYDALHALMPRGIHAPRHRRPSAGRILIPSRALPRRSASPPGSLFNLS
jgi:BolA protein